jgi:hypothetical protein
MTKTGFGLVIGFIDQLQVVTIIDYHTVPDLHTPNHSKLSLYNLTDSEFAVMEITLEVDH